MIKIQSWLKKDEVEENEKLRETERAINKQQLLFTLIYALSSQLHHLLKR